MGAGPGSFRCTDGASPPTRSPPDSPIVAEALPSPSPLRPKISRQALLDALREGIIALTTSEQWAQWLRFSRRLPNYSFHNQILILGQFPGATQVAGYRSWQSFGRQVRRGERGIAILAPIGPSRPVDADALRLPPLAFKTVRVFDVSQTDGPALPVAVEELMGPASPSDLSGLLGVASKLGFRVEWIELRSGRRGDCSHALRRIRVHTGLAPAQALKTLAHELGHAILHGPGFAGDRSLAELEAESCAFVTCSSLGIDSSAYSFGYVATWAGGGPEAVERIGRSASRIIAAASVIVGR